MSEPYGVHDVFPSDALEEFEPGTNVVIVGPSMSGKRALALELLAAGYQTGDGILCITTDSAEKVHNDLERYLDSLDRGRVGIIDTSGSDGTELLEATIESISSPGDLTGISVSMAKLFQHFERRGISDIRYGLISISTLLQYLDTTKVFRFLHVYTKRIEDTGGLGIYTLNNDSHDQQVINTITGQFDVSVELRETESGELEFRVRGPGRRPTPWEPL